MPAPVCCYAQCNNPAEDPDDPEYPGPCRDCSAAELASEARDLAYAESGGGSEMANDLWAGRVFGDE